MVLSYLPRWPALLLVVCLVPSVALAQQDAATADALFREGKQLAAKGDWVAACPRFAEGHRLRPAAAGILLNLANCEEQIGQLVAALDHFRKARVLIGADDPRTSMVDGRVSVLERRIVQATFRAPADFPPDSRVLLDDVPLLPEHLGTARAMDPGPHTLRVRSPGRKDAELELLFQEGASLDVELPLGEPLSSPTTVPPTGPPVPRERPSSDGRIPIGIAVGAVGLVGVGAAIATGIMVGGEQDTVDEECDASSRRCSVEGLDAAEAGQTLLVANAVAWGVGIVGVGAGAALLISAVIDAEDEPVGLAVQPTLAGTTLGVRGRF